MVPRELQHSRKDYFRNGKGEGQDVKCERKDAGDAISMLVVMS